MTADQTPPHPYRTGAAATAPSTGTLGRTAFLVAIVLVVVDLLFTVGTTIMVPLGGPGIYSLYSVLHLVRGIIGILLAAAALVLGVMAARRGAQPVLAGIAIGVGAVHVLGILIVWASTGIAGLMIGG